MKAAFKKLIFFIAGLFFLAVLIVLCFLLIFFVQGKIEEFNTVLGSMCGTHPGFEVLSPDKKRRAVVYEYDCGAIDGFSTNIAIIPMESPDPSKAGTTFTATGGKRKGHWNGPYVEVVWETPLVLKVKYDKEAKVFIKSGEDSGVNVKYEEMQ